MKRSGHVIIDPPAAIPGGEVAILLAQSVAARAQEIWCGDRRAHAVAANSKRLLALVPGNTGGGVVELSLKGAAGKPQSAKVTVGRKLADGLHPVANPAFDPADGSLFVTRSGSRGEHVPVSIYQIAADGSVTEFSGDVTNPTAIAFDRQGQMFATSRFDGSVYRITTLREVIEFAGELGIATGLAFRSDGVMFVGDRTGTIFSVNEIGEAKPWVQLEPSVSAYHLAFAPDDALYVTGPTVSSFDCITRVDSQGESSIFYRGLGRPQGLAFDREGNLYVAASLRGRRGIVRITANGTDAQVVVAGMNVVGLAFGPDGEMIVATNDSVYSLPLEIHGTLLDQ
jgi:sugar lactone lactonase YvrE